MTSFNVNRMQRAINEISAAMVNGKTLDAQTLWLLRPGIEEIQNFLAACGWHEDQVMAVLNWERPRRRWGN